MKQGHKPRVNPFAAIMRPGEETLWFRSLSRLKEAPESTTTEKIKALIILLIPFICAAIAAAVVPTDGQPSPTPYQREVFLQVLFIFGALCLAFVGPAILGVGVVHLRLRLQGRVGLDVSNYAVTNRRLLFSEGAYSASLALADIDEVIVYRGFERTLVRFEFKDHLVIHSPEEGTAWVWNCPRDEDAEGLVTALSQLPHLSMRFEV